MEASVAKDLQKDVLSIFTRHSCPTVTFVPETVLGSGDLSRVGLEGIAAELNRSYRLNVTANELRAMSINSIVEKIQQIRKSRSTQQVEGPRE